ncbi:RNA polymerase sigma factor [Acinetobacter sp. S40]|uniref:RNA polymerase sigma factor n=1 Tax=Acinetobacter sp. S40 TaxID=2767434 RepID=UPI00190D4077|nr:RNA polymerase sigma factor [Acinetobacter sp. S40]MBJ9983855.1 RNA polymerase sigma factor [Acinetobacter sp. S40]
MRVHHLIEVLVAENDRLVDYISYRFGDRQFAQEVVQETSLRVLQQAHTLEEVHLPLAFLKKMSMHVAIDFYRKEQIRKKIIDTDVTLTEIEQPLAPELTSPELAVAKTQREQIILKAIYQLPPCCQDIFILAQLYHFSQQQISNQLNISRGMVARHLARAYRDLLPVLLAESHG